jgi:hypothetical protein
VLLQYQGTLATIPKAFEPSIERSATLVASYQPDGDLTALMERYRTGPFRPVPQLYESVAHGESDVVFGIDLRKWAEGGWNALTSGEERKDLIPPVLTALLDALTETYGRLPNDSGEWNLSCRVMQSVRCLSRKTESLDLRSSTPCGSSP